MSDVSDQRRYYERMIDEIAATHREQVDQLQAENDRLRELVRDMWRGAMGRMDYVERHAFAGEFADRMRKLEVSA